MAALLDVIGFSSLVASERHGERMSDYLDCLKDNLNVKDENIKYVVFSDSIVVITTNDDEGSLQKLLEVCSSVFAHFYKGKSQSEELLRTVATFDQAHPAEPLLLAGPS